MCSLDQRTFTDRVHSCLEQRNPRSTPLDFFVLMKPHAEVYHQEINNLDSKYSKFRDRSILNQWQQHLTFFHRKVILGHF